MPVVRINEKIVYFAHIPKCAGTSVEEYLQEAGAVVAFLDHDYLGPDPETHWNKSSPQHIDGESLVRLFPPEFFDAAFTISRHPVKRFLSAFHYQREVEQTIPADMPLEKFVEDLYRTGLENKPHGWKGNHFVPMHRFLAPGYDVKRFRLEDGLEWFQDWLEDRVLENPTGLKIGKINTIREEAGRDYEQEMPSETAIRRISELYAKDFEVFGYPVEMSE